MPFYDRDDIRPGLLMTLDCSGVGPAYIKMSPPRPPVRYGDEPPDFSEISQRLDETRQRLEKLRADLRAVRGRK